MINSNIAISVDTKIITILVTFSVDIFVGNPSKAERSGGENTEGAKIETKTSGVVRQMTGGGGG